MRKNLWAWILMGTAVVLLGSYGLLRIMSREPIMPIPAARQGVPMSSASVGTPNGGNPLLTADKVAVSRWFPSFCFAELYNKEPSFDGQLIPSCIVDVIQNVKAETGVTLTQPEIQSPEVLAHFKAVYGDDDRWRQ